MTKVPVRFTSTTARQSSTSRSSQRTEPDDAGVGDQAVGRGGAGGGGEGVERRVDCGLVGGVGGQRHRRPAQSPRPPAPRPPASRSSTPTVQPGVVPRPGRSAAPSPCPAPVTTTVAAHRWATLPGRAAPPPTARPSRRAAAVAPATGGRGPPGTPREMTWRRLARSPSTVTSATGHRRRRARRPRRPARRPRSSPPACAAPSRRCGWRSGSPRAGVSPMASTSTSISRACQWP